ncbi:RDD family protein [Streptomonospora halophila]|uniref:RDD family protein n=1 Tax=Streptomonospora halophila TaxID=427369 RepID=UPI0031E939A1
MPTARRGQSLGKRIVGIRVVSRATGEAPSGKQAASREGVFVALYLTCMIGHVVSIVMAYNDERTFRSLQDRASGTRVITGNPPTHP